jgi:hypothetical protein
MHRRFDQSKNSHQQRHINLVNQIPCHRHFNFLLEHPPRTIRIYGHQLIVAPSGKD